MTLRVAHVGRAIATLCLALICTDPSFAVGPLSVQFNTTPGPIEQKASAIPWPAEIPRRTKRAAPLYPPGMGDVTGLMTMQITLGRDGRVAELRPLYFAVLGPVDDAPAVGTAQAFAAAATDAVNAWEYEAPARGPVTFMMNLVIRPGAVEKPGDAPGAPAPESRIESTHKSVKKTHTVEADYPAAAAAKRIQGVIVLEATIGPDGRVLDCRVLRAIPYLSRAALDAVAQWEFDAGALFSARPQRSQTVEFMLNFKLR
jgi:TonB family protein